MLALCSIMLFAQVQSVQFYTSITPHSVYVGQQLSYDAVMRADALAQRSFQAPPEYTPPDVKGVTLYDFPFDTITSMREVQVNGVTFKQYTYHRAIFPLMPGTDTVPPGMLVYVLPKDDDPYASQVDSLRSAPQIFAVLPLPTAGRPPDFSNAVGRFSIAMHPDSHASFRVGTSFVLYVIVTGTGNIDLLPRPALTLPWATVVPTLEQVRWDSTQMLVHGAKEFQFLVTPQQGGSLVIPPMRYSYFDPATKQYVTALTAALPVMVAGGYGTAGRPVIPAMDTVGTTPFPTLVLAIRAHLVLVILLVLLVLVGVIALVVRTQDQEPID